MQSSTTDDRSLSAEGLEVDESSSLNHGEEQVREAPSEQDKHVSKHELRDRLRSVEGKIDRLCSVVESIQEQQMEHADLLVGDDRSGGIDHRLGRVEAHLLKLKQRFCGGGFDPNNPAPAYQKLIELCKKKGELNKHDASEILDVGSRQALRKIKNVGRRCEELRFVSARKRSGNDPSVIMPRGEQQ